MSQKAEQQMPKRPPVILAVLDGWGVAPPGEGNAVALARTPFLDDCRRRYPTSELQAHGRYVGLLPDQEGNSEAGHMNIGGGRTVRQDIVYVTEAIKDRTFFKNTAFREAIKHAKKYGTRAHLMGLLSNGNSAHSSPEHIYALLELLRSENVPVILHLFTDGRDSLPFSASHLLHKLEERMTPDQKVGTVMGRFYAMDRNRFWHRTELAYRCIISGEGLAAPNPHTAILRGYNRGETDEFIIPTVMVDERKQPIGMVEDNDVIFSFNLRSDRARQLAKTFVQPDFEKRNENAFTRRRIPRNTRFVVMTDFGPDLPHTLTAFLSHDIQDGLTETLAPFRQFYIAESEKYAHVTYFMNGGYADQRFGEERMRVPSQFVAHHDTRPEMRAAVIVDEAMRRLRGGMHDFIAMNIANADMVAHTGNIKATVKACEIVDKCLARLAKETLAHDGHLIITGDHGNAEKMIDEESGEILTEHTVNPVPFHIVSERFRKRKVGHGMLGDVAPTLLEIMEVPKPQAMSGFSLLRM